MNFLQALFAKFFGGSSSLTAPVAAPVQAPAPLSDLDLMYSDPTDPATAMLPDPLAVYAPTGLAPVPLAPITAAVAPTSTITPDGFGVVHLAPGAIGTLVVQAPWPHVDLEVEGSGHLTSLTSDNDNVISSSMLSNFVGSSTASAGILSVGQANLTIGWIDGSGNAQTTTMTVFAD